MENATQALFMAAGVLIALVVISLGILFFSSASSIGESYEIKMSAVEIQKFNNQFEKYSKQPQYVRAYEDEDSATTQYHYINNLGEVKSEHKKEYVFHDYNSISDVVSAINLAYNINSANDYEQDAGIQVSVEGLDVTRKFANILGINPSIQKNHYNSNPKNLIDKHCIYELDDITKKKIYSENIIKEPVNLNDVLKEFNTSKLDDNNERIYKYGFKGETVLNEKTGLIHIVKFELVVNENYDVE